MVDYIYVKIYDTLRTLKVSDALEVVAPVPFLTFFLSRLFPSVVWNRNRTTADTDHNENTTTVAI